MVRIDANNKSLNFHTIVAVSLSTDHVTTSMQLVSGKPADTGVYDTLNNRNNINIASKKVKDLEIEHMEKNYADFRIVDIKLNDSVKSKVINLRFSVDEVIKWAVVRLKDSDTGGCGLGNSRRACPINRCQPRDP